MTSDECEHPLIQAVTTTTADVHGSKTVTAIGCGVCRVRFVPEDLLREARDMLFWAESQGDNHECPECLQAPNKHEASCELANLGRRIDEALGK